MRYVHMGRLTKADDLQPLCGSVDEKLMTKPGGAILADCPDCLKIMREEMLENRRTRP